jgi:hypothetical protein
VIEQQEIQFKNAWLNFIENQFWLMESQARGCTLTSRGLLIGLSTSNMT